MNTYAIRVGLMWLCDYENSHLAWSLRPSKRLLFSREDVEAMANIITAGHPERISVVQVEEAAHE